MVMQVSAHVWKRLNNIDAQSPKIMWVACTRLQQKSRWVVPRVVV